MDGRLEEDEKPYLLIDRNEVGSPIPREREVLLAYEGHLASGDFLVAHVPTDNFRVQIGVGRGGRRGGGGGGGGGGRRGGERVFFVAVVVAVGGGSVGVVGSPVVAQLTSDDEMVCYERGC